MGPGVWGAQLHPGYPVDYYGAQQKMSEDEVKKALAERQDFRAAPSYIGDWKTGILDCCAAPGGCETCLLGCCCPWALMGQNTDRLPPGHYCANGSCLFGGFTYLGCCLMPCIGGPLWAVIHHCRVRSSLRRTYGLPPEPCPDCCVVCLCPCCAVIQEHNELDIRGATQWNAPPSDSKPIERNAYDYPEVPIAWDLSVPQLPAPSMSAVPMLPAPMASTALPMLPPPMSAVPGSAVPYTRNGMP